jgi:hypothetical protein
MMTTTRTADAAVDLQTAPPEHPASERPYPACPRPLVDPAAQALHERLCPRSDCWWG